MKTLGHDLRYTLRMLRNSPGLTEVTLLSPAAGATKAQVVGMVLRQGLVLVALVLVGAVCLASYLPARRAAKLEPMVALRHE